MSDYCRACPVEIMWALMPSGKRNPLNQERIPLETAQADPRGIVAYDAASKRGLPINKDNAHNLAGYVAEGKTLHISHWATCRARKQVRRETDTGDVTECPVEGCQLLHPRSMLMCRPHWHALPKPLRDALWDAYNGDGVLSDTYRAARDACIAHAAGR